MHPEATTTGCRHTMSSPSVHSEICRPTSQDTEEEDEEDEEEEEEEAAGARLPSLNSPFFLATSRESEAESSGSESESTSPLPPEPPPGAPYFILPRKRVMRSESGATS